MFATAKNYDVICLQMRSYLPHLDTPIKKETNKFLGIVKKTITADANINDGLNKILPDIFNFRFKALKWLLEESEINFHEIIKEVYPWFEEMKSDPKLAVLAENILFAIRCNQRVINALFSSDGFRENIEKEITNTPTITYEYFLATLAFGLPDENTVQKVVDWAHSSLRVEFILLAAAIIYEESVTISDKTINEMAYIVADAAQEYLAIATEMGLLPNNSNKRAGHALLNKKELKEEKYLADLGLPDFSKNF